MDAKFFPTQADFRRWLEVNHEWETELTGGVCEAFGRKIENLRL